MANIAQLVKELVEGGPGSAGWKEPKYLKKDRTQEKRIAYKGKSIAKLHPSGMYEFYSDAKERFLKFDDLGNAKAAIDAESSVSEAKKRTTFDPISKKKVPVKSIKTKAGGPVTRGGKPVPDEELKSKDRFKKKQEESTDPADIRRLVSRLLSEDCGNVCHQCGKDYRTDENGVNTHCGPDGEGDFDADLDHVPYGEPGEGEDRTDGDEFSDYSPVDRPHGGDEEFRNPRGDTGSFYGRH